MKREHRFNAVIEDAGGGGAYVTIPFDVEQVFGKKRVKVRAALAGEPYRGSLVRMGTACHVLGVRKDIRAKTGRGIGDLIDVGLSEDVDARVVEVPADLQAALDCDAAAAARFAALAFTHQQAYVSWITSAKRAVTRAGRLTRALALLVKGVRNPR